MQASHLEQNASPSRSIWWRRAAQFLALSGGVPFEVLEQRGPDGQLLYTRGRYKYYGLGALVIFFAVFSGYGMGHMLATMSQMSAAGALLAGMIWAAFQWCLERQMLLSITQQAAWPIKLFGFCWRAALALLSALTLVYPFFVASNRAEIDVRTAQITRSRMIDNVSTAALAVGLPVMQKDLAALDQERDKVEQELRSEPPQLPLLKQSARQCWSRYARQEQQLKKMRANTISNPPALAAAERQLSARQTSCQQADAAVSKQLRLWQQEKNAEKTQLDQRRSTLQTQADSAKERSLTMEAEVAAKLRSASASGFAADFVAVADLLRNDLNRQIQFIWWTLWFFIIELVAIIVKFMSRTDVDLRLHADETWTNAQTEQELAERLQTLATEKLATAMQAKGTQADLSEDDGLSWQARATDNRRQQQRMQAWQSEITQPALLLEATLAQMQKIDQQQQRNRNDNNAARVDAIVEQAQQQLLLTFQRQMGFKT